MTTKQVLITGGAGFIGTHICEKLVKRGIRVKVIDDLSVGDQNVGYLKSLGVDILKADISDYKAINEFFDDVHGVIHLAAMNRAQRSIDDPLAANRANITGTLSALEASRRHNVKRFVMISSSSVYGNSEEYPRQEDGKTLPPHPYGVGKLAGEHYTRVFHELFGIKASVVRLFSVFGPRQRPDIDHAAVIPKFIYKVLKGVPVEVYGDGSQKRSFTYVDDAVEGILSVFDKAKGNGDIFNISSPEEVSVNKLINTIEKITGKSAKVKNVPAVAGDPHKNTVDMSKARQQIGFESKVKLEEGLKLTYDWLTNN